MPSHNRYCTLLALFALVAAPAGAQTPDSRPQPMPSKAMAAPAGAKLGQSDALGVLAAINQSEIAAGQLALKKVASGPVHEYAQRMVTEHGANNGKLQAYSPNLAAPAAKAQQEKGKGELARLSALEDAAFSKAYVQAMVKDHAAALATLDRKLIPAAKDAPVRAFLEETRSHVADHLAAARRLPGGEAVDVPQQESSTR